MGDLACDWVTYNAGRYPDRVALLNIDTDEQFSWAEVEARTARLAGVLAQLCKVERGDRVAIIAENDSRFFETQFACMRLGAIFTPLNWRLTRAELEVLIAHCDPQVIVHDEPNGAVGQYLGEWRGIPTLAWGRAALFDYETELTEAEPITAVVDGAELEDVTHIIYTSGSTGVPKGVMTTRKNMIWNLMNIVADKRIDGPDCRMYNPLPLFHAGGLTALANPILQMGGSLALARRVDSDQAAALMGDPTHGITHCTGVLTSYQAMTESVHWGSGDFTRMKYIEMGGSRIPEHLQQAFARKGMVLQSVYGATETGPAVTQMPPEHALRKHGSMGRAVPHTQIRLIDVFGADAAENEIGEIWVAGPSITSGYWLSEEQTAKAFEGPWFKTGDAAYKDSDGFYYAVDRFKNMYKSGGENVFPAEVEVALRDHPLISEVTVIGVPDTTWGETGLAVVVTRGGAELTLQDIGDFVGDRLARYKLPRRLELVDSIPHHQSGKVDLRELRARYANSPNQPLS